MELIYNLYQISIDTTFANRYKDWINNKFDTEFTVTWDEGEYSMYIDAVKNVAYKSSYNLEKPYPLTIPKNMSFLERQKEFGRTHFDIFSAFREIRKDGGFKVFEE